MEHRSTCTTFREAELKLTEVLTLAKETNIIVGGDFNVHHEILGSRSETNVTGRHLATLPEKLEEVTLINDGEPTNLQGNALDFTLATSCLASRANWIVHPTLTSDHGATVSFFFTRKETPQ